MIRVPYTPQIHRQYQEVYYSTIARVHENCSRIEVKSMSTFIRSLNNTQNISSYIIEVKLSTSSGKDVNRRMLAFLQETDDRLLLLLFLPIKFTVYNIT